MRRRGRHLAGQRQSESARAHLPRTPRALHGPRCAARALRVQRRRPVRYRHRKLPPPPPRRCRAPAPQAAPQRHLLCPDAPCRIPRRRPRPRHSLWCRGPRHRRRRPRHSRRCRGSCRRSRISCRRRPRASSGASCRAAASCAVHRSSRRARAAPAAVTAAAAAADTWHLAPPTAAQRVVAHGLVLLLDPPCLQRQRLLVCNVSLLLEPRLTAALEGALVDGPS